MKMSRAFLAGIVFTLGFAFILHAQATTQPIRFFQSVSASDLSVMLEAAEQTEPMAAELVPRTGTFYSAQHAPGSDSPWPPMPGGLGLPAWNLGGGVYLLDDMDYSAPLMLRGMMNMNGLEPSGGGGTNGYEYSFTHIYLRRTNYGCR